MGVTGYWTSLASALQDVHIQPVDFIYTHTRFGEVDEFSIECRVFIEVAEMRYLPLFLKVLSLLCLQFLQTDGTRVVNKYRVHCQRNVLYYTKRCVLFVLKYAVLCVVSSTVLRLFLTLVA